MNYSHADNLNFNNLSSFKKDHRRKEKRRGESKGNIVLVDDEDVIREVTAIMLEALGYRVISFPGGSSALHYFHDHSDEVDLFLLDVVMPGMDGRELFTKLKKINPEARGFYYSAYSSSWEKTPISRDGVLGLISKPVSLEELKTKVGMALSR